MELSEPSPNPLRTPLPRRRLRPTHLWSAARRCLLASRSNLGVIRWMSEHELTEPPLTRHRLRAPPLERCKAPFASRRNPGVIWWMSEHRSRCPSAQRSRQRLSSRVSEDTCRLLVWGRCSLSMCNSVDAASGCCTPCLQMSPDVPNSACIASVRLLNSALSFL